MGPPLFTARSWNGRHLKMTPVKTAERERIVQEAIAKRAFRISERRGFESGHELEDWRRAESEILRPLNCGFLILDRKIELSADGACFDKGEIEIFVEPRRVTICGNESVCPPEAAPRQADEKSGDRWIIRSLELPFDIEPSKAAAKFNGRLIEMDLPKAGANQKAAAAKDAA
jgi:HSP20 family protein